MQNIIYALISILLLFGSIYFLLKIIDWYSEYKKNLFPTNHEAFISDCLKLEMRWLKRGETLYAGLAHDLIIKITKINEKSKKVKPEQYGADIESTINSIQNDKLGKIKEVLSESITEDVYNW